MLVLQLITLLAALTRSFAAFLQDHPDRNVVNDIQTRGNVLTNAERLAKGMIPAIPKALERILPTRSSRNARDETQKEKRQIACPSSLPIVFPPQPPNPTTELSLDTYDDDNGVINLPFQVKVFDQYSNRLYVAINGYVSILTFSSFFVNEALPSTAVPLYSVLAYWDDLQVNPSTDKAIRYAYDATSVTIRWVAGQYISGTPVTFTMYYTTNTPGKWYIYYGKTVDEMGLTGESATVGAQGGSSFTQYEFDTPGTVPLGLRLAFDTNCPGRYATA